MARIAKMRATAYSGMSRAMVDGKPRGLDTERLWTYWMVSVRVCHPFIQATCPF